MLKEESCKCKDGEDLEKSDDTEKRENRLEEHLACSHLVWLDWFPWDRPSTCREAFERL